MVPGNHQRFAIDQNPIKKELPIFNLKVLGEFANCDDVASWKFLKAKSKFPKLEALIKSSTFGELACGYQSRISLRFLSQKF